MEQRAMRRGAWGTMDCLLMDDVIMEHAKSQGKKLWRGLIQESIRSGATWSPSTDIRVNQSP